MSRTFRPTDTFVDESLRGQRYLLACVLVEARHLADTFALWRHSQGRGSGFTSTRRWTGCARLHSS